MQATEVVLQAQQVERMTLAAATGVHQAPLTLRYGHDGMLVEKDWKQTEDACMSHRFFGSSSRLVTVYAERGLFAEAGIESVPRLHRMAAAALTNNYLRKAMNAAMEIYKVRMSRIVSKDSESVSQHLMSSRFGSQQLMSKYMLFCMKYSSDVDASIWAAAADGWSARLLPGYCSAHPAGSAQCRAELLLL